jgi:TonB family protein
MLASGLIAPEYPAVSRRLGEEGRVLYRVAFSPGARPAITLLSSSGFERLDGAARRALEAAPPEAFGIGAFDRTVLFRFRLKDENAGG